MNPTPQITTAKVTKCYTAAHKHCKEHKNTRITIKSEKEPKTKLVCIHVCWERNWIHNKATFSFFLSFFLYGAAAHIGPWPPLYEIS
jgi:hypothetical protein